MPDIFFAFAINEEPKVRRGCQMDSQYMNFEIRTLLKLRERGLSSSPLAVLNTKGLDLSPADYYCFSWLVAEIKYDAVRSSELEKLYCQAANGASVALKILTKLAKDARNQVDQCHIPPVITITFEGDIKVWLAYASSLSHGNSSEHAMVCIWGDSIADAWGSLRLECILENAKAWALRILKPTLSNYIEDLVNNPFPNSLYEAVSESKNIKNIVQAWMAEMQV